MQTATAIDLRSQFLARRDNDSVTLTVGELRTLLEDMGFQMKPKSAPAARTESDYKTNGILKARAAEPFRTQEDFSAVAEYLRTHGRYAKRNYMLIMLGTTLGLRCGDLLRLTIGDVYDTKARKVRDAISMIEDKTNKRSKNIITEVAKQAIDDYIKSLPAKDRGADQPLLSSSHRDSRGNRQPLTISMVWRILNDASKAVGLSAHIGTHSMRKTYGYAANKTMTENGMPSAMVMELLQAKYKHSSQDITLRYIGLEQDGIDSVANMVGDWVANSTGAQNTQADNN